MKKTTTTLTPAERRVLEDLETHVGMSGEGWVHPLRLYPDAGANRRPNRIGRELLYRLGRKKLVKVLRAGDGDEWRYTPIVQDVDEQTCRVCACTERNACYDEQAGPCHWVEADLCSQCQELELRVES